MILPHEDVMEGPVDDRTVLMRTTETNLEPILLVHEGTDELRALIAKAAEDEPLAEFVALDGSAHRLWARGRARRCSPRSARSWPAPRP